MSLILDALKKLDREKISRQKGMPDLAAEVLRADPAQSRKRTPMYLLAVSLTALATAGITYAVIVKPGFLPKSPSPSTGTPPAPSKQVASAPPVTGTQATPSAPLPVILPAPGQKEPPTSPGLDSPAKSSPPAPKTPSASPKKREAASVKSGAPSKPSPPAPASPSAPGRRVAAGSPKPSPSAKPSSPPAAHTPESGQEISPAPLSPESARGLQSGAKPELSKVPPGKVSKPGELAAGGSAQNPPPLKISGIVWNEDPSSRRAVINGSLTSEGSTIEGVKVVEIFPTKVRFLYQGAYFEISVF